MTYLGRVETNTTIDCILSFSNANKTPISLKIEVLNNNEAEAIAEGLLTKYKEENLSVTDTTIVPINKLKPSVLTDMPLAIEINDSSNMSSNTYSVCLQPHVFLCEDPVEDSPVFYLNPEEKYKITINDKSEEILGKDLSSYLKDNVLTVDSYTL